MSRFRSSWIWWHVSSSLRLATAFYSVQTDWGISDLRFPVQIIKSTVATVGNCSSPVFESVFIYQLLMIKFKLNIDVEVVHNHIWAESSLPFLFNLSVVSVTPS